MHILLIDDSSSTRSLLRTLINAGQSVRHEISEAASGEESLQKVGSGEINLPDLIIMDINMGGMSGFELCREFRQRYGTASDVIPYIIIVTANEGVDVINQALDSGANDYMPKPVNVKILQIRLKVAERLLAQAQAGAGSTTQPPVMARTLTEVSPEVAAEIGAAAVAAAELDKAPVMARTIDEVSPEVAAAISATAVAAANLNQAPALAQTIDEVSPEVAAEIGAAAVAAAGLDPAPAGDVNFWHAQIGSAIEQADAPIALIDVTDDSLRIVYANSAFTSTTQYDQQQLMGQSLAEMEAWTPEFLKMTLNYIGKGTILSYAPLWSRTRQTIPVHLSFYPIRAEDETASQYLVIHHF